jgi:ABC-type Mn2+/Zn2+ transport system permease subunit
MAWIPQALHFLANCIREPLEYPFMVRALLAGIIVGVLCAVIGCYVVLRSMAFLGDAMAHAILPGVAVACLLGKELAYGALVAALAVALGLSFFTRRGTVKEDTAIGILFAGAFSLGVALISTMKSYAARNLTEILFGNILGVAPKDLARLGLLAVIVLAAILLFYREFLVISFDPILALTLKLKTERLQLLMFVLLALTIVVSLQTVGVGLAAGMLVTPGAAAYLLARRLPRMMAIAAAIERRRRLCELLVRRRLRRGDRPGGHRDLLPDVSLRAGPRTGVAAGVGPEGKARMRRPQPSESLEAVSWQGKARS